MEAFLGEIKLFAGSYAPTGWAFCDGSMLAISGEEALFHVLGTTYGGDGLKTFALPDLQGRVVQGAGGAPAGQTSPAVLLTAVPGGTSTVPPTISLNYIICMQGVFPPKPG